MAWLDDQEGKAEEQIRRTHGSLIDLYERQLKLITTCVRQSVDAKVQVDMTVAELKNCSDGTVLRNLVPRYLLVHAVDNLHAARLNMLHGYLSVAYACMRNTVESLRWANAAEHSAKHARAWLTDRSYPKEVGFELDPQIRVLWDRFGQFSKRGAHPLSLARTHSSIGKPAAEEVIGPDLCREGIESVLRILNQVAANFLFWISSSVTVLAQPVQEVPALMRAVHLLHDELSDVFDVQTAIDPPPEMQ